MTKPNREPLRAFAGALNQFIGGVPIGAARPAASDQAAILHAYGLLALAAELRTINSNLVAIFGEPETACHWHETGNGMWQGDCGIEIMIDADIVAEDYHYCPQCGERIHLHTAEEAQP